MARLNGLKDRHLQILSIAQSEGLVSRKQISQKLGLPLPTVIRLVADLLNADYLAESNAELRATPGRPNTPVTINGNCAYSLGIDLHPVKWSWAVADAALNKVASEGPFFSSDPMTEQGVAGIMETLRHELGKRQIPWDKIKSIVIGAHAIVTATGDIFVDYGDLESLMNLTAVASAAAGKICISDDPARLFCEIEHDPDVDGTDAAYMLYGLGGHGMGIVALGKVLQSFNGICGEIGHLAMENTSSSNAPKTLEQVTDGNLILKQAEAENWSADLPRSTGAQLVLADICRAARSGHAGATEVLRQHARILAPALASVVSLIGCETLVIGGLWEDSGERVLSCFQTEIKKRVAGAVSRRIKVRYATHGVDKIAYAAARYGARQIWLRYPANF